MHIPLLQNNLWGKRPKKPETDFVRLENVSKQRRSMFCSQLGKVQAKSSFRMRNVPKTIQNARGVDWEAAQTQTHAHTSSFGCDWAAKELARERVTESVGIVVNGGILDENVQSFWRTRAS